jgi:hypothetical protein
MSEVFDLRHVLDGWPYDPENNVRVVLGNDGREVLQVRLCMGIEQYEMTGRPDGKRPHGKDSAFDHYQECWVQARDRGEASTFALSAEQCAELFTEGMLYYYRYLNLFQVRNWGGTIRDTTRNLRLFDFVHRHAEREEDQNYLEQWRPYIMRINVTAAAMVQLEAGAHKTALELLQQTMHKIESLSDMDDQNFQVERKRSLLTLRELARQIEKNRPVSEQERLQGELRQAIAKQEFERAAELRDRIRALSQEKTR